MNSKLKTFLQEYLPVICLTIMGLITYLVLMLTKAKFSNNNQIFFYFAIIWLPALFFTLFKVRLPLSLKISFFVFTFFSNYLATVFNLYSYIPYLDTILHCLFGYIGCYIGLFLLIQFKNEKTVSMTIKLIFCFALSLALGSLWEVCEFTADVLFAGNTQHVLETGIKDTMDDILVHDVGSLLFIIHFLLDSLCFKNRYFNYVNSALTIKTAA